MRRDQRQLMAIDDHRNRKSVGVKLRRRSRNGVMLTEAGRDIAGSSGPHPWPEARDMYVVLHRQAKFCPDHAPRRPFLRRALCAAGPAAADHAESFPTG